MTTLFHVMAVFHLVLLLVIITYAIRCLTKGIKLGYFKCMQLIMLASIQVLSIWQETTYSKESYEMCLLKERLFEGAISYL